MPGGIAVANTGYTAEDLTAMARRCKNKLLARRLRAMARVLEGALARGEITLRARVDGQTLCDWIHRYNAAGVDGLKDRPRSGRPPKLDETQRVAVGRWLEDGPDAGVPVWTLARLKAKIEACFGVVMSVEAVRRLLRALGFRKLSPRPLHPKADPQRQAEFRSDFSAIAASSLPQGTDPARVDVWFQDEARIGQKGMLTRVWARWGSRPRVPRDHRYGYCYLFSALCPANGLSATHVCDRAHTDEMNRHLHDISAVVPSGRHALVVLDGAGWHRSKSLETPHNLSLLHLPPYSPELNPVETVFQFPKAGHFANHVFAAGEDVKDKVGEVWETFVNTPDQITSIGSRMWARLIDDKPTETPVHVGGRMLQSSSQKRGTSRIFDQRGRLPLILRNVSDLFLKGIQLRYAFDVTWPQLPGFLFCALANAKLFDGNGHAVVLEDAVEEPCAIQNCDWNAVLLN